MSTTRAQLETITTAIHSNKFPLLTIAGIRTQASPAWSKALNKIQDCIASGTIGNSIFTKGNSKLPFLSFSSLPGAGFCPGAGQCLQHCYSFKAWRYPQAFSRQVQNHLLLQTEEGRAAILADLDKKTHDKKGNPKPTTVRLYVDGDFYSAEIAAWWMQAIAERPHLSVYGYSKSFDILLQVAHLVPDNYVLNISNGHNASAEILAQIKKQRFARGEFIAVEHADKTAYKEATGKSAFVCPGKCGSCLPSGIHACGQLAISKDIIISVH